MFRGEGGPGHQQWARCVPPRSWTASYLCVFLAPWSQTEADMIHQTSRKVFGGARGTRGLVLLIICYSCNLEMNDRRATFTARPGIAIDTDGSHTQKYFCDVGKPVFATVGSGSSCLVDAYAGLSAAIRGYQLHTSYNRTESLQAEKGGAEPFLGSN